MTELSLRLIKSYQKKQWLILRKKENSISTEAFLGKNCEGSAALGKV